MHFLCISEHKSIDFQNTSKKFVPSYSQISVSRRRCRKYLHKSHHLFWQQTLPDCRSCWPTCAPTLSCRWGSCMCPRSSPAQGPWTQSSPLLSSDGSEYLIYQLISYSLLVLFIRRISNHEGQPCLHSWYLGRSPRLANNISIVLEVSQS